MGIVGHRSCQALALLSIFFLLAHERSSAGWRGAEVLRAADPEAPAMTAPHIVTDNHGFPWTVWVRVRSGHESLEMSRWDGSAWTAPEFVPDTDDHIGTYLDLLFDGNDDLFLAHPTSGPIESFRYDAGREWTGPFVVSDMTKACPYYCYPRIAIGGGEIWAAWFCTDATQLLCDVSTCHWNRDRNRWDDHDIVMPVQFGTSWSRAWFPDIAVDGTGVPHIVWTFDSFTSRGVLYYSRYEHGAWREKERVTPDSLIPTGPYNGTRPRLVVDDRDNLHCCFLGSPPGDPSRGVYYCKYTASTKSWSPIVRIDMSEESPWLPWDKDIAVAGPDDVWVAYDFGIGEDGVAGEPEIWRIYVRHFDGGGWSEPERIDDGAEFQGGFAKIALDRRRLPFVVWAPDNTRTNFGHEIWFNRYEAPSDVPGAFLRGDSDADGAIAITDAIFTLGHLFGGGPEPVCLDAADADDGGALDLADPIVVLEHLFLGSGPLPVPFGECGVDPKEDALDCASYPPCGQGR